MNKITAVILSLVIGLVIGGGAVMALQKNEVAKETGMMHQMPDGNMMQNMGMQNEMDNMMMGLEGKTGEEFDKAFLAEMIMHHQGAVIMAEAALQNAKHQEIKDLANAIITAQNKEIADMKMWRKNWYNQ